MTAQPAPTQQGRVALHSHSQSHSESRFASVSPQNPGLVGDACLITASVAENGDTLESAQAHSSGGYSYLTSGGFYARPLPSAETLRDLLRCDTETGRLYWRERPSTNSRARTWNTRFAHTEAFTWSDKTGARTGKIFGKVYYAHRVIWKTAYGSDPSLIDHINGDPSDNRLCNLRTVDHLGNLRNQRRPSNNASGVVGVSRADSRWQVSIGIGANNRKKLGYFNCFWHAVQARRAAEREFGYHENHGKRPPTSKAAPKQKTRAPIEARPAKCEAVRPPPRQRGILPSVILGFGLDLEHHVRMNEEAEARRRG